MTKDGLQEIFERQYQFNRRFFSDQGMRLEDLSEAERVRWTKEFILHLEGEFHELLRESNWKMHHLSGKRVNRGNVLEEWTDCFKFLVGLANLWGFSSDDVLEEFRRKSQVVEYRYGMERRLRDLCITDVVVAVDIDGVLNDYPEEFCEWVLRNAPEFENQVDVPNLSQVRELGPRRYLELKDAYRNSGEKANQRVKVGAKELLDGLRAAGATVILLSKRPYWRIYRIYADTLEYLERNGLRYDGLLFHQQKHRKIVRDFPELVCMIEDDPHIAREVAAVGHSVILVDGELNENVTPVPGVIGVPSPEKALSAALDMMKEKRDGR